MKRLLLAVILFAAVLTLPTQADFIQCVAGVACPVGSANADLMNGSAGNDIMQGQAGNDLMFGGDGNDIMSGGEGNDLAFGGNDSDTLFGGLGLDTILPGPDGVEGIQLSVGEAGNDTFIVLVGETTNCQQIVVGPNFDVLHLIGFGPYVAEYPYGQPEPVAWPSWIVIQDPVVGGYIIATIGDGPDSLERINGLSSPNVTVLGDDTALNQFRNQNCSD